MATASSSPFSFHCMICYEEFDTENRYPVVLPCGHTYVCSECANRIDRCMECRTSVFETMVRPPNNRAMMSDSTIRRTNSHSRLRPGKSRDEIVRMSGGRRVVSTAPSPSPSPSPSLNSQNVPKKRLPLPKNVVLMSLMHATELTSENTEYNNNILQVDLRENESEDESEQEKITRITEIASGACGTYAVAAKEGLEILPMIPNASMGKTAKKHKKGTRSLDWESRVDHIIVKNCSSRLEDQSKDDVQLRFGDRVQVVTIVDGWAKLARGYGFVRCEGSSGLVKVGGALDKACNLEAMIISRSLRKKELRLEQARVEKDALNIMKEMQNALRTEEDLTVIAAEAFPTTGPTPKQKDCRDDDDHIQLLNSSSSKSDDDLRKSTAYVVRDELRDESTGLFCLSAGFMSFLNCDNIRGGGSIDTPAVFPSTSRIDQSDMVAGAQKWRLRHGKEAVNGPNFQTGISCHHGIQSTQAHLHFNLLDKAGLQALPKMSSHSGLTIKRRLKSTSFSFG